MLQHLVELTRSDAGTPTSSVLVNLDNVAWIEPLPDGGARLIFAVALAYERANGLPLQLAVRETVAEIALLAGAEHLTDRDAIARAWAEQSGRRDFDGEQHDNRE
jgi:hypothetical protein